jgi:hypothetical protein
VLVAAVLLIVASSYDIVREIAPAGDDWLLLGYRRGGLFQDFVARCGWARPLGLVYLEALVRGLSASEVALPFVLASLRVVAALATYAIIRVVFRMAHSYAFVATVLFMTFPTSVEGWAMLNTAHLAVGATLALLSAGLYLRARDSGVSGSAREFVAALGLAGLAQLASFFLYEQGLLALPVFVMLVTLTSRRTGLPRIRGFVLAVVPWVITVAWSSVLVIGGYAANRQGSGSGGGGFAELLNDVMLAGQRLWIGAAEHHIWRLLQAFHEGLPSLAAGPTAFVYASILTVGALTWVTLRQQRDQSRQEQPRRMVAAYQVVVGAIVVAYASLIPVGAATPGFPLVSRMYVFAALPLSLGVALVVCRRTGRCPRGAGLFTGAFVSWCMLSGRHYASETRQGSLALRGVAAAVAALPSKARAGDIVLLAPSVLGTFNTQAVQPLGSRQAITEYDGSDVGPLYFSSSCRQATASGGLIDETGRAAAPRNVTAVIAWVKGEARVFPTLGDACVSGA